MSDFTSDWRSLDAETREYLAAVARSKGDGSPGVFLSRGAATGVRGCFSLILGAIVVLVGWGLAATSTKAPWAVALLFTASTVLGGWLIVYPFRRLLGGGLGTFTYFDPHSVYQVDGREVRVTDLRGWTMLTPEEIVANDNHTRTKLHFQLPGRQRTIEVRALDGDLVADYYAHLQTLDQDANWASKSAAESGATAKYMAKEGYLPDDPKLIDLTVTDVPEEATTSRTTGGGMMLRYIIVVAAAGLIYLGSWGLFVPLQDDMAYQEAQKHGVQGYRDYLLDDRNTRHRDEAKAKIRELYAALIAMAGACPDPVERQGWSDLLQALSECEGLPVVSLGVTEDSPQRAESHEKEMRMWLADSLGSKFGPAYVGFVEAPAEVKPLVELKFRLTPAENSMQWQLLFRSTPEAVPLIGPWHTADQGAGVITTFPPDAFRIAFFQQTFRTAPPAIYAAPTGGGDFDD